MATDPNPEKSARAARLASALRDNLKKRKAQARGRTPDKRPDAPAEAPRPPVTKP